MVDGFDELGDDVDEDARRRHDHVDPGCGHNLPPVVRSAINKKLPYAGQIDIGGVPTAEMTRRHLSELVAFLPQRPVVPEGVTVADYVAIGRTPYVPYWGSESGHDREVIAAVLVFMGENAPIQAWM